MKIKEFKTIASGVFITIKKMFEFKIKHKNYLLEKDFTDEKINEITENFTVFLYDYEKNEKEKETFILETLLGFSFFHNHELFKKLQPKIDKNLNDILENLFTRDIYKFKFFCQVQIIFTKLIYLLKYKINPE